MATNRGEQGKRRMDVLCHTGCFGGTRSISATSCLTAAFVSEKTFDANSSPTSALGSKFITLQCVLDACGLRSCNSVVIECIDGLFSVMRSTMCNTVCNTMYNTMCVVRRVIQCV